MASVAVLRRCTERANSRSGDRKRSVTCVELRGFEPLTPSMRTRCATGLRYSPWNQSQPSKLCLLLAPPTEQTPTRAAGEPLGLVADRPQPRHLVHVVLHRRLGVGVRGGVLARQ